MELFLFIRFADPALEEGGIDLAAAQKFGILDRAWGDFDLQFDAFARERISLYFRAKA